MSIGLNKFKYKVNKDISIFTYLKVWAGVLYMLKETNHITKYINISFKHVVRIYIILVSIINLYQLTYL